MPSPAARTVVAISLRNRIMLLVAVGLLIATVPLGIMGLGMVRAATDRVLEERLAMAQVAADYLNERVAHGWWQLNQLATRASPHWASGDLRPVRQDFATLFPQMSLFSGGIFLAGRAGRVLVREPATPPLADALTADPAVQRVLASGRQQTSRLIRTADGAAIIFAVPVFTAPDAVVGVVGGIIDLKRPTLLTFIDGLVSGSSGHAAIVGTDGIVLASTDEGEVFSRNEHPEFFARFIREGRPLVGRTHDDHGSGVEGEIHVMAFAPITATAWGLGIGQTEEETFGPLRRLRDRIVGFELIVLAGALVFAWLDTNAVVRPVRVLQQGAERIATGDLAQPIAIRRSDEIGRLAESFEAMRVQLLQSLQEVRRRAHASQTLYELGTLVLSLHDRNEILRSIATHALTLLGAEAATVCLLDESSQTARVAAVAGAGEAVTATGPFPFPADDPMTGCRRCAGLAPGYLAAHLAAPLAVLGRPVGALCVGARAPREYSAEDQEVLGALANLAAISVENARLQERVQSVAILEERERIAREMHDSVGQVLGYVNTKAQAVEVLLDAGRVADARLQLSQLEAAARDVYSDLREAILNLRAVTSPDQQFIPTLRDYVRRFTELSGIDTACVVEGEIDTSLLSPTTGLHLLRIIQEALTNVRRHALARHAQVAVSDRDGTIVVTVTDNGTGFELAGTAPPGGALRFGLQMMRERSEAIGGTFQIRSGGKDGTEVEVRVPVRGARSGNAHPPGG